MLLVRIMQLRPVRHLGVRLVGSLARVGRFLERRGAVGRRITTVVLLVGGRIAAAVTAADELCEGRCVRFGDAVPGLVESWQRDRRALGVSSSPTEAASTPQH